MEWSKEIKPYTEALTSVRTNEEVLQKITTLLDLTSLNETDTEASIAALLEKARTNYGSVAGVCVYPKFIRLVAAEFAGTNIKAITVANFPEGQTALEDVLLEIGVALENGAQEIDIVFPYRQYLAGDKNYGHSFVTACKAACGSKTLKIILETGAMNDLAVIADAAKVVLMAGADFVKTSTGKFSIGATIDAAAVILLVIKELQPQFKHPIGLKVAGGLTGIGNAAQYIELADRIMGKAWVKPNTFRIGSSKLIDAILSEKVL